MHPARLSVVALVVVAASACSCSATVTTIEEPDQPELDATLAGIEDDLTIDGALLDDSPDAPPASVGTTPAAAAPPVTRASVLARPLVKLLRAWGAAVRENCVQVTPQAVDADHDGIPQGSAFTFDCAPTAPNANGTKIQGTALVTDLDDDAPSGGFTLGFRGLRIETSATGATRTLEGSIIMHALRSSPLPGADIVHDLTVAVQRTTDRGVVPFVIALKGAATYAPDPDLATEAWSARGTVASSARVAITAAAPPARAWNQRTDALLHYNRGCKVESPEALGFDRGAARFTDIRHNTLRLELGSCTERQFRLNGRAL